MFPSAPAPFLAPFPAPFPAPAPPRPRAPRAAWQRALGAGLVGLVGLVGGPGAMAQTTEETPTERAPPRSWDAAVGFVIGHGPRYPGSASRATRLTPGLALRWGRVSIASRSAFSVRGAEAGSGGGLRVELAQGDRLRAGLGLRLDSGRRESDSPELRGLGDIRRTVRLRLSGSYRLDDGWRVRATATTDALGRGGGTVGELQLSRDRALSPTLGVQGAVSLGFGNRRHMQTYFGISPEQALRSGYAETPMSPGLRDLTLSAGWRRALKPDWALFGGAGITRLIDQAAASPLVRERDSWSLSLGLVHRF